MGATGDPSAVGTLAGLTALVERDREPPTTRRGSPASARCAGTASTRSGEAQRQVARQDSPWGPLRRTRR